jgi:hypothetical protein
LACGFPAVASAVEIEEAITGVKRVPRQSRKEWQAARRVEISALPFWKKPIAYVLQFVRFVGAVIMLSAIFKLSGYDFMFGFAIVAIAEFIFHLLKGRPYAWEEN